MVLNTTSIVLALITAVIVPIVSCFVTVVLMRRKYKTELSRMSAEISRIKKDTEGVNVSNTQKLINIVVDNVAKPLEIEIKKLRQSNNKLSKAIEKINDCPDPTDCPVKKEITRQNSEDK